MLAMTMVVVGLVPGAPMESNQLSPKAGGFIGLENAVVYST